MPTDLKSWHLQDIKVPLWRWPIDWSHTFLVLSFYRYPNFNQRNLSVGLSADGFDTASRVESDRVSMIFDSTSNERPAALGSIRQFHQLTRDSRRLLARNRPVELGLVMHLGRSIYFRWVAIFSSFPFRISSPMSSSSRLPFPAPRHRSA